MKKRDNNFEFIFYIWILKFMFKLFMTSDNDPILIYNNTSFIQSNDDINFF